MNMPPPGNAPGKKEQVQTMFDNIAPRYDFLNHFLSLGIDIRWRRRLVTMAGEFHPDTILDVATGTGDLAIALASLKPERITGLDISAEMLRFGVEKISKAGLSGLIEMKQGDSEALPFPDASYDLITAAFGVRNFEDLDKGLSEMYRVTRQGGKVMILEFSRAEGLLWKGLFNMYFRFILPLLGRMISRHDTAYRYLPASVGAFPSGTDFIDRLHNAGFRHGSIVRLSGGVASIYSGQK